eukprot:11623567-Heterocapsa_arctica.AAC.1
MAMSSYWTKKVSYFSTVTKANGETLNENHYDLMHPTIQQICKTKTYSRRSELQQVEHHKQEDTNSTDRHRQTMIGEEQTKQTDLQEADKLGPNED